MLQINCHFNHNGECSLLNNVYDCTHCSFYKTSQQFYADYNKAADNLNKRGLKTYIYYDLSHVKRIGVKPIKY